jgi:hypothetical protein
MSILGIIVSIVALGVSVAAYRVASNAFRLAHSPLVRVVGAFAPQFGVLGRGVSHISPQVLELDRVILKNIGPAPALAVVAFDPEQSATLGEAQLVEPLGAGEDEASRIGRVTLTLQRPMVMGNDYHLYCQDTLGGWHLTRFRPWNGKIECTFVGHVKKVPGEVEPLGTVLKP